MEGVSKLMSIYFHFIRVEYSKIKVKSIRTKERRVGTPTKALAKVKFQETRKRVL